MFFIFQRSPNTPSGTNYRLTILITVKELIHPHLAQFTYANSPTETLENNLINFSNPQKKAFSQELGCPALMPQQAEIHSIMQKREQILLAWDTTRIIFMPSKTFAALQEIFRAWVSMIGTSAFRKRPSRTQKGRLRPNDCQKTIFSSKPCNTAPPSMLCSCSNSAFPRNSLLSEKNVSGKNQAHESPFFFFKSNCAVMLDHYSLFNTRNHH